MLGILKFFAALNSNGRPTEIAVGIAYGFWLALIPISSLFWIVLLIISSFFKINQAAVILIAFLLKLLIGPLTPLLDYVGWLILSQDVLLGFFIQLRNMPILPWTRFYNSVVMGAFVAGPFLAVPVSFIAYFLVQIYRKQLRDRFLRSKLVQSLNKLPIVQTLLDKYHKASELISILG